MSSCRCYRHKASNPRRARSIFAPRSDQSPSLTRSALVWAFVLIGLFSAIQPIQAHQTREHILLARQVELPGVQAVVILISNQSQEMPGRPCHFNGAVRTEEIPPPFGSGLDHLVFKPVSLAPGESLAIDIPPPDIGVAPSQIKVLIMAIEADDAVSRSCPLLVQAMGYDNDSGATEVLIDRFTFGFEKNLLCRPRSRPLIRSTGFRGRP
jgi:hypothetical protein